MGVKVPDTVQRVSFHRRGGPGILVHVVFVLLYGLVLQQCYNTLGEPYDLALAEQERLAEEKMVKRLERKQAWLEERANRTGTCVDGVNGTCAVDASKGYEDPALDVQVEEAATEAEQEEEEEEEELGSLSLSDLATDEEEGGEGEAAALGDDDDAAMDGLSLSAVAEEEAVASGEADGFPDEEDEKLSLPSKLLPGFWPCFFLAATIAVHVLFMFMSHWSVRWRVFMQFRPTAEPTPGSFAFVTPLKHQGKDDIVAVTFSPVTACLSFVFQRHKYICKVPGQVVDGEAFDGKEVTIDHLDCPDNLPLRAYLRETEGLSDDEVRSSMDKFGVNSFEIPCPTFYELWKTQLMSPVAVFQIFCMLLWMLDEYWKYTAFTLVMILGFEASTAFTRLRNLKTIRGMGNKPSTLKVYRGRQWLEMTSDKLLPGDLFSLCHQQGQANVVPCDALMLSGSAVVNESTLTGESIPQMKGSLHDLEDRDLDIDNRDKIHTLFSGTTLMQHSSGSGAVTTPDGGILCFALRTGFRSSQGALMRMVEFSTDKVAGDKRETAMLLCLLFCFACMSSGYVLYQGLKDPTRSRYQLLLRCVLILTSVVPPDLPMQMALAVQTALMALHKAQVFCTEPFRIPMAGKVTHCLFDKTGTLTTDQLVAVGVVDISSAKAGDSKAQPLAPMDEACDELSCVVAGCHSLIEVQSQLLGDPIELAALGAIKWLYKPDNQRAIPAPPPSSAIEAAGSSNKPKSNGKLAVEIVERHHFSSALQRMSTIAKVTPRRGGSPELWSLVKGSPEAIGAHLTAAGKPAWFDSTYTALAERGMRILALAYKRIPAGQVADAKAAAAKPREWAESDLQFAGFVAFSCLPRKDTSAVIAALNNASQYTAMITGDAPLTALQVAAEVGITRGIKEKALLLEADKENGTFAWKSAYSAHDTEVPFDDSALPELGKEYDLMVTGAGLDAAAAMHPGVWRFMDSIRVFARMSPDGKAEVIKALKEQSHMTLMCGDGGNDVGALKQADVGLALLSGFGNMNAESSTELHGDQEIKPKTEENPLEKLRATQKEMSEKSAAHRKRVMEGMAAKKKELAALQPQRLEAEVARRKALGQSGMSLQFGAVKQVISDMQKEMKEYQMELMKGAPKAQNPLDGLAAISDESGDMVPIVKLGDASIAAPFTSKMPSISSVMDIVRQGRCTLVNTIQQQQILMLNCMISAFCLAVMHMQGSRSSEEQLISTGMALTVASMAFSFATPVETLSSARPLTSVFHPALFVSVLGQLAIHISSIVWVVVQAKERMGEDQLQEAIRMAKILEKADVTGEYPEELLLGEGEDGNPMHKKHYPNLLNTCVFLVETSQQVSVMFVNYKGRPWMLGTTENTALLWSLAFVAIGLIVAVNEFVPRLNKYLGMVEFPDDEIKRGVVLCVAISMIGSFIWDRLCLFVFARDIFMASIRETTNSKLSDYYPQLKKLGIAAGVGLWLYVFQGNLLMLGGLYWLYRQRQKQIAQAAAARQGQQGGAGAARPAAAAAAR